MFLNGTIRSALVSMDQGYQPRPEAFINEKDIVVTKSVENCLSATTIQDNALKTYRIFS